MIVTVAIFFFVMMMINLFAFASHDDRLKKLEGEKNAMRKIGGIYG